MYKSIYIKYINSRIKIHGSLHIYKCILFLKKALSFLEVFATRQNSVYFACQVKAAAWSTHRVWEDVFVCTIAAAVFSFSPLPSQTPPSIPHQALQFAPLKFSLFVSSECPPPNPTAPHPLLLRL